MHSSELISQRCFYLRPKFLWLYPSESWNPDRSHPSGETLIDVLSSTFVPVSLCRWDTTGTPLPRPHYLRDRSQRREGGLGRRSVSCSLGNLRLFSRKVRFFLPLGPHLSPHVQPALFPFKRTYVTFTGDTVFPDRGWVSRRVHECLLV